ncbi:MAG: 30S ribosomal protein S17 [Sulfolobales archaeon]|nr:30S ribosomal protein S17 [Sulfolobales archaeon]MCX8186387.1 30S ribosomal protein S17 [Sulfolobales archaeon]MDW7968878.1 30S ribosomal protein S17 [Sulfolobales archaeon]
MASLPKFNNVGISYEGLKPPQNHCDDPACPWHGHIKVRGLILEGTVIRSRMDKTVVVEREYTVYSRKYMRYERRRSRIHAHNPPCINAKEGDLVVIGETRPISKSVSKVVLGVISKRGEG